MDKFDKQMEIVQDEGGRKVRRRPDFYNLDAIISVGYRVNSIKATNFRIWATQVLKEYMTKEVKGLCGCYIDEERSVIKVNDIDSADYPPVVPGLPEGAYHIYDYQFFYRNLQENVEKRVSVSVRK